MDNLMSGETYLLRQKLIEDAIETLTSCLRRGHETECLSSKELVLIEKQIFDLEFIKAMKH